MEIIGIAQEGHALSVADGPDGTPSYQWQRSTDGYCWTDIRCATDLTYTLTQDDENNFIRIEASFEDDTGQTITADSDPTCPVIDDASLSVTITGIAKEHQVLNANPKIVGDASDQYATVYYQWQTSSDGYCWTDIRCATDSTYTLTQSDENNFIRVEASFVDATGQTITADSDPTCSVIDDASLSVAITGITQENQILTATPSITGDASDQYATVYYQWQTSSDGYRWTDIRCATDSTYTLTEAGENHIIRVEASFVDATAQTITADSDPTCSVIDDASLSVAITGTALENQLLTANPTILGDNDDGEATVSYHWQSSDNGTDWSNISDATGSTYTVAHADVGVFIRVEASFTDDTEQLIVADSDPVSVAASEASVSLSVTISGVAQENQVLTASPTIVGEEDDEDTTVFYQWQSSTDGQYWTDIRYATESTYTVAEADENNFIRVEALFFDYSGQAIIADSDPTLAVIDDASLSVAITGTAQENQVLTATRIITDEDDQDAKISYQWQSSTDGQYWTDIRYATDSTYTVAEADENKFIRVEASFVDDTGQTIKADSDPTLAVIDDASLSVALTGIAQENQVLTATPTIGDEDDQGTTVAYQWQSSTDGRYWTDIRYATDSTYTVAEADENNFIRVEASFVDDTGQTVTADSDPTSAVIDDASLSVMISGTAKTGHMLSASSNDRRRRR